jgi:hypothetical protein
LGACQTTSALQIASTQQSVDYSRGHAGAHCGKVLDDDKAYCQHFIPPLSPASNLGQCQKVAGPINPVFLVPVVCSRAKQAMKEATVEMNSVVVGTIAARRRLS